MRLKPEQRHLLVRAVERGVKKSIVAKVFGITRKTLYKWLKRKKRLRDRKAKRGEGKITLEVELAILGMRNFFKWGSARIQQGLMSLPKFVRDVFERIVQGVKLSRTAINNVLRKHKLNGYHNKIKSWKFFRAKFADELWQLDIKGPYILQGKKYWFVVCVDDYSRYLLVTEMFEHTPTTKEMISLLGKLKRKPKKILTDNAKQFAETWKRWCKENSIEPLFAHPYYPQDKGKVERAIRNLCEEFINLLKKFPQWLNKLKEYRKWHNEERFHRGINAKPIELYKT